MPLPDAVLPGPEALAEGPGDVLYVNDENNYRVVRVTSAGIASVVVGNGIAGFAGDGGPATKAEIYAPNDGLATDAQGNLYIADGGNSRIREVSAGVISTVAGNGAAETCTITSPDNQPATQVPLAPYSVAINPKSGAVYFLDNGCPAHGSAIRMITSSGTVTTVVSGLSNSSGIRFDSSGNLYVGVQSVVEEYVGASGSPVVVAGKLGQVGHSGDGGPATQALLSEVQDIAFDGSGDMLIDDTRVFSPTTGYPSVVRMVTPDGNIHTVAGYGADNKEDFIPANQALLCCTSAVAADSVGDVFLTNDTIRQPGNVYYDALRMVRASGGHVAVDGSSEILPGLGGSDLAGEETGGCNATELCPQPVKAEPVNVASGDFYSRHVDLAIPGRGVPLALSRSYDAFQAASGAPAGPLGFGWALSYGMSLRQDPGTQDVTVTQEDGAQAFFVPNGSGGFASPTRVLATLVQNGDGSWTFTRRARTKFFFSSSGQLIKVQDLNGYATSLSYDALGRLAAVSDPAGRSLSFSYDPSNRVSQVSDPAGRAVKYGYDGGGNLAAVTDLDGGVTSYAYDGAHRLTAITDARGHTVLTNSYDSAGRVAWQKDGLSRQTTFSYAPGATTTTTPAGNKTEDDFASGELYQEIRGVGSAQQASWQFHYDPVTLGVTQVIDPNGHTTTNSYDSSGNLLSSSDPLGHSTGYQYDSLNDPTSLTDPNGVTTNLSYDAAGNLLSMKTLPSGTAQTQTWGYAYGDSSHPGDVTQVTDPDGNATALSYDASGDRASATDAAGDKTTFGYDQLGRRTSMVSPNGNAAGANPAQYTTSYSYDNAGNLQSVTDPLGHTTSHAYDQDQNLASVTDADTNKTSYAYDNANQLTTITRADGSTLSNGYDAVGNLSAQTDGASHTTSYGYDPLDRLASMSDTLGRTTSYGYDGAGNLTTLTDPQSRKTTYGYDAANRLSSISYSDGKTPNVTYGYDNDGQRTSMSDGTGTSSYRYDSLHRLTSTTDGAGNTIGYSYDLADNQTSITYPNGQTVTRTLDQANRLASVTDWQNNKTSFAYDHDSNPVSTTFPTASGNVDSYNYNNADQLTAINATQGSSTLANLTYTRDPLGLLSSETQSGLPGAASTSYTYTKLNQLATAGPKSYSYDKADNLTQLDSSTGYNYDAANQLTSSPTSTYSYDQLGERTSSTPTNASGTNYSYDQAQRLTKAAPSAAVRSLAGGDSHSLALRSDGTVWAWGGNGYGQLGNGITTSSSSPVRVSNLTAATAIAAGGSHSLALKSDGTVWAWGDNYSGQLGNGNSGSLSANPTPAQVANLTGATAVAAGGSHSLAAKSDGTVWAWGDNTYGQLGNGTITNSSTPVQASNLSGVTTVAGGGNYSLALKSDGTVWAWGYNKDGELGNGTTKNSTTPVQVSNLTGATAIAAGADHSLAVKSDGTVWAWGYNGFGELGNGTTKNSTTPVQVSNLTGVSAVAGGEFHSLALKSDGTLWGFGYNIDGEFGNGTTTNSSLPVQANLTGAAAVGAGANHSLTAKADGTAWAWGRNDAGQLGNGTTTNASTPVQISNLNGGQGTGTTYTYNGDGLRTTKTTGTNTSKFTWDQTDALPLLLTDSQNSYIYGPDDLPIEQISSNGTPSYLHHDQLGSTRLITNQTGTTTGTSTYNPYGAVAASSGSGSSPLGYAGQYTDPETGLQYNQARYYDPNTGQFLTRDPINPITRQPYGYTSDNPTNATDPSGMDARLGLCPTSPCVEMPEPAPPDVNLREPELPGPDLLGGRDPLTGPLNPDTPALEHPEPNNDTNSKLDLPKILSSADPTSCNFGSLLSAGEKTGGGEHGEGGKESGTTITVDLPGVGKVQIYYPPGTPVPEGLRNPPKGKPETRVPRTYPEPPHIPPSHEVPHPFFP